MEIVSEEILQGIERESDPIVKQTLLESYQEYQATSSLVQGQEEKVNKMLQENAQREKQAAEEIQQFMQEQQSIRKQEVEPLLKYLEAIATTEKTKALKQALKNYVEKKTSIPYSILLAWEKVKLAENLRIILDNF